MKRLHQEMRWCDNCKKTALFQGNKRRINWLMHIGLMFLMVGFITLPIALISRMLTARVGGKHGLFCSGCGLQV